MDMHNVLTEYKKLLEEGVITQEEFDKKKRELLNLPDLEKEKKRELERQKILEEEKEREVKKAEEQRKRKLEEIKLAEKAHEIKLEEERIAKEAHQRKLAEERVAERAHQRKMEEARLAEEQRQRNIAEEKRKEKEIKKAARKKKMKIAGIVLLAVVLLAGIVFAISEKVNKEPEEVTDYNAVYEWPEDGLAQSIPEPEIKTGEIGNDNDIMFDFDLYQADLQDFEQYVSECKKAGYTETEEDSEGWYAAYNENKDRYVDIRYRDEDSEIYVALRAPEKWEDISWPKSKLAKSLPVPEKLYGMINWDESDNLDVDIANVSEEEFNAYIDRCIEAGYNVDYSRDKDSFSAKDKDGNELDIRYEYFDVMNIDIN